MDTDKRSRTAIFWGVILVAAGAFLLTQTLGLVPTLSGDLVGAVFAIAGLAVLISYPVLHTHWWTLIAGPTLLGLAGAILLTGDRGGSVFLGAIGLGFVLLAVTSAQRWWAVIPAGTLLTLALIALLSNAIGDLSGALLFLGLAATFGVLAVIPVHGRLMRWPVYPALGLVVVGLLIATAGAAGSILWPLVLVALGLFLLVRASTRRAGPSGPGALRPADTGSKDPGPGNERRLR